ncbi:hypothetical protein PROFUN_09818 [Planoprotostelium fungivorum]|uniref:C2 domain-containing protein n=1 Tax=Planoprotostelium fungivorum TaxID=1890364 RepID=A0A2P6NFI8_9EUKA|nr:hypothetical protein PROFUN_09818 [Planoprotostelium fungivorum]
MSCYPCGSDSVVAKFHVFKKPANHLSGIRRSLALLDHMCYSATRSSQESPQIGQIIHQRFINAAKVLFVEISMGVGTVPYYTSYCSDMHNPAWNDDATFTLEEPTMFDVTLISGSQADPLRRGSGRREIIGHSEIQIDLKEEEEPKHVSLQLTGKYGSCTLNVLMQKTSNGIGMLSYLGEPVKHFHIRLDAGDVVLLSTNYIQSPGIRLLTWSHWDHCGIIVKDEDAKLNLAEAIPDDFNITMRLLNPPLLSDDPKSTLKPTGRPYKVSGELLRALFNGNLCDNHDSFFCSELVAAAYKSMGVMRDDVCSGNFLPKDFAKDDNPKNGFVEGKLGEIFFLQFLTIIRLYPCWSLEMLLNVKTFLEFNDNVGVVELENPHRRARI